VTSRGLYGRSPRVPRPADAPDAINLEAARAALVKIRRLRGRRFE